MILASTASVLLIYSILTIFYEKLSNGSVLKVTRRIWYSLCLLLYAFYLLIRTPESLINFKFLKPNILWDEIALFIIFTIGAVIIDTLILRAASIKTLSLGTLGGVLEEEDAKKGANQTLVAMDFINSKIEAEFDVIQNIEKIVNDVENKLINGFSIEWLEEIEKLIKQYCEYQQYEAVDVNVYDTDSDTIKNIKEHYKLTKPAKNELERKISSSTAFYCDRKIKTLNFPQDIYFIPVELYFYDKQVLVTLKGIDNLAVMEKHIIANLVKAYEMKLLSSLNLIEKEFIS